MCDLALFSTQSFQWIAKQQQQQPTNMTSDPWTGACWKLLGATRMVSKVKCAMSVTMLQLVQ